MLGSAKNNRFLRLRSRSLHMIRSTHISGQTVHVSVLHQQVRPQAKLVLRINFIVLFRKKGRGKFSQENILEILRKNQYQKVLRKKLSAGFYKNNKIKSFQHFPSPTSKILQQCHKDQKEHQH